VESADDLLRRQDMLQAEADELLAEAGLVRLLESVGPVLLTGSYVSGLMSWREVDVMALVGPEFAPHDVLDLMRRVVGIPGVTRFDYRDERGERRPTEHVRDERYHVEITLTYGAGTWHIDLSLWLHDIHANITEWHEQLRASITPEERDAVLRIKDVWHKEPSYQGGLEVYTAVLEHGVRTPEQFGARRGLRR
jgi:hypothetical protein